MTYHIGVDPGKSGAVAIIDTVTREKQIYDYTDSKGLLVIQELAKFQSIVPVYATVEKVGTMPGQGISSSGKFMFNAGEWAGIFKALDIPHSYVTPQKWQKLIFDSAERLYITKSVPVYTVDESGRKKPLKKQGKAVKEKKKCIDWKNMSLDRARRRFPRLKELLRFKKHHNRSDALLIAEYGRLTNDK